MTPHELRDIVTGTWRLWSDRGGARLGAALAYYTAFSIAPVLLVVIGVAGIFFDAGAARARVIHEMEILVGPVGAVAVNEMLGAGAAEGGDVLAVVVGAITVIVGATTVFYQLQEALDLLWDAPPPRHGLLAELRGRGLSLAIVLGLGFLLLAALVVSAALTAAGDQIAQAVALPPPLLTVVSNLTSIVMLSGLFAMLYKVLPRVRIAWREVFVGAFVTALLFTAGKGAIGLYLGHSTLSSAYGAAGSFAVFLVWVYYSAQLVLLGAAFTRVWSRRLELAPPSRGSGVPRLSM